MANPLRVGIIGASADGGWARDGHVPAVQALGGLELVAVATNGRKTADAAARAFGVEGFASGLELIRSPDIDVVTVATRVADHRALVLAALEAGRHLYSEWPLGAGQDETDEMAAAADRAGVHTAIGLQLRESPAARRARALIASGTIGRVLGVSVQSATAGFGPDVAAPFLYLEAPEAFANLVTIQGAHTIDLTVAVAGGIAEANALATTRYPEIRAGDTGERRKRTTFDHLLLQGRLTGGGSLAVEVSGGRPSETPSYLEVVGETGTLRLDGGAPRGVQSSRLLLSLNGMPQSVDEGELAALPDAAANVGGVYARLRDDIARGTSTVAGFGHAATLTRLMIDTLESSQSGRRMAADGWPSS